MPVDFWVCAVVTIASAFVSLGYATAAVRAGAVPDAACVPSRYAFARSLALAAVAVVAALAQSTAAVEAAALAMVLVQAGDAVIGALSRDRLKTFGPAATAAVNAVVLIWLLKQ
ncbi:MAG: hypothetical protein M3042_05970 [Actinomycetota bacterium]|nr:hypothetical protein [Actinomycetota bacterium]